jgi:DNA-binding NtrC family response regulator
MDKTATRVIDASAAIVRQRGRGRLLIVKGKDRGESIAVGDQAITLGSGSGSDILLSDPTVSRRHLGVEPGSDGVIVRDLGSTNGSFVQGARFQELTLGFGAEVTIGHTVLKYVPDEEAVDPTPTDEEAFGSLVGRDAKLRKLFRLLGDVAGSDATVLLEGETGTGKELLAEEIHRHSARRAGPFVVFDCGAVPSELIESALFGHVRGAFTGAISDRRGAFAEADGGTIFLDEIGELSPEVQPVLLRALDKHAIRPVGGASYEQVSVRVVAATNRNLRSETVAKRFREDLYYRLAVVRVSVPALRQRLDDIPLLVDHFIRQFCGERSIQIAPRDLDRLRQHAWPGNVRELRNVIERACALCHGNSLEIDEAFESRPADDGTATGGDGGGGGGVAGVDLDLPFKLAKARVIDSFERAYIQGVLARHKGNLSAAARSAEVDRKHFRELLRKHGLRESPDS